MNIVGLAMAIAGLFGYPQDSVLPIWYHAIGIPICLIGAYASWRGWKKPQANEIPKFTAKNPWGEK